jgi:hypothetical protein
MEDLIRNGMGLSRDVPSVFTREWLHQVLLSVLVKNSDGRSLKDVLESFNDHDLGVELVAAAREVFGATPLGTASAPGGPPDPGLVNDLANAVDIPSVMPQLRTAASALWEDPDPQWVQWIQERYVTTLASAMVEAIQSSCPDVDASDLRCDIEVRTEGDIPLGSIHISEDQPGGVGILESFVDRYIEDPRAFWALVTTALGPSDGERVDMNLRHFVTMSHENVIAEPSARIRTATELADLTRGWRDLRHALFTLGIDGDQSIISALATRLIRSGSTRSVEDFVSELLERWDSLETSLGIEVELRVFAHAAASDPDMRRKLHTVVGAQLAQPGWEIGQIVGLLWPRGNRLRAAALRSYSPYVDFHPTERLLFEDITDQRGAVIDADGTNWRRAVDAALRSDGSATIRAPDETRASLVICDLLTEPTSVDVLEIHPRVIGVSRSPAGIDVSVELREAQQ